MGIDPRGGQDPLHCLLDLRDPGTSRGRSERQVDQRLGGIVHQELRAALYGAAQAPRIHGYLAGVGGVNLSVARIGELVLGAIASEPTTNSLWTT